MHEGRQLAVLRHVADPIFIVAGDPAPYESLGVDIVPDSLPNAGALGGIYTAIVRSPHERTLIVACDMPFLALPLLRHLTSVVDADLVIPRTAGGYEPLCAVYGKACAEPIRRRIESGDLRAAVLPDGVIVEEVGPEILAAYDPDGVLFVNVNTPHDWEQAHSLTELEREPRQDRITD
ncbi:MAG: molybdenum cofactor guanylyltransferase [Acidobacteria bacterium]|nr:molybdenum cofactor guanylyltransferase [Acidobacteriota bacterium]